MDNALVAFPPGMRKVDEATRQNYHDRMDEVSGILALMNPMRGAVEAFKKLCGLFDTESMGAALYSLFTFDIV